MKLILERWRKLLEGEVIDLYPTKPEKDMQSIVALEGDIAKLLGDLYGNQSEIPIEVLDHLEGLIDAVERNLPPPFPQ